MVVPLPAVAQEENKPVRGVKLKTVSAFTLLFALACLAAFIAGRPPVAAADSAVGFAPTRASIQRQTEARPLRQDDSRHLFRGALSKREPGTEDAQKSARARAPVRFLPANSKQKNKQTENI